MIEVSLYSIPAHDLNATVGTCIDRARFDHDKMGTGTLAFVKGFLKTNVNAFETSVANPSLISVINSDVTWTAKDLASVNYWLIKAGFIVKIQNVTEDEENPVGVSQGTVEWNIIDYNFMQFGYPTATKIIPTDSMDIPTVLRKVIENSGLFAQDRFVGVKNPLTELLANLDKVKDISGTISPSITTKIYEDLDQLGIKIFIASGDK